MSSDQGYQAFRRSGQTGKTRSIAPPTSAEQARKAADGARQRLEPGSSDTFEVRKPRR